MAKSFKLWLEEKEIDRKLKHKVLSRLGFQPELIDVATIKLRDLSKQNLFKAVSSIGLDQETVEQLRNFIETNPDTTLQNLLDQINDTDIVSNNNINVPGKFANLPKGQEKPELLQKLHPDATSGEIY